jgi:hypothetical protein
MSRLGSLARLAAAYAVHQVRRRVLRRGRGGGGAERVLAVYASDRLRPLTPAEREQLPAMSGCINCGICALVAGRVGWVRLPDLASGYLRHYPLLADSGSDLEGEEGDLAAAAAACPVGVPLEEVAAMVRRLSQPSSSRSRSSGTP